MALLDVVEKAVNTYFRILPRKIPSKDLLDKIKVIAHRGAHSHLHQCKENTDKAFARAEALGCWGIELDIHATKDQVIVVNHDPTLNRIWGVNSRIDEMQFDELRQQVPSLPSLEEVISRYGKKMHLFIEIKAPFHAEEALLSVLKPLIPIEDYHLISLDEPVLHALTGFPREAQMLVASHDNTEKFCELCLENGYGGVLGHYLLFSNTIIKKLQSFGKMMGVGFVNSENSLYREVNRGLTWLFSDKVDNLSKIKKPHPCG